MCVIACFVVVVLSGFVLPSAEAQVLRGQVVDSLSGRPVGSGFVVLLNDDGREVFRTLADATGRFAIQATTGTYRLRSERIGYVAFVSPPITLAVGETLDYELRVTTIPTQLSAITVTGSDRCRQNPADAANTATLWEEARKALAAAAWTFDRQLFRYTLSLYERELDRRTRRIEKESRRTSGGYTRSPFRSARSALDLAENGYVTEDEDGGWTYDAPDANVLMSDPFLTTHCFSVVRNPRDAGRVGLAFEPVEGDRGSDVAGVLWLDESTAQLRRLEFRYTELPYGVETRQLGGDVGFMPVSSGAWVIRDWEIRMPSIELDRTGRRERVYVAAIFAAGGRVVEVLSATGELVYAVAATLDGMVYDSTRMVPLADAMITIPGAPDSVRTDTGGWFRIVSLVGGDQEIRIHHSRLDSVGFTFPDVPVALVRGDTVTMVFAVPSLATIRAVLCPDSTAYSRQPGSGRVLFGFVRDETGTLVAGAVVTIGLGEEADAAAGQSIRADDRGWYVVCGLPVNREVTLQVRLGERRSRMVRLRFTGRGVMVDGDREYRLDVPLFRKDLRLVSSGPPS